MKDSIIEAIKGILIESGAVPPETPAGDLKIVLERPADMAHGDYATNVAMVYGPKLKKAPLGVAIELVEKLRALKDSADLKPELAGLKRLEKIEVAGPGFINFYINQSVYQQNILDIRKRGNEYGMLATEKGKKIAVEYTDPNPFKIFHIGHLMDNVIGESIARLAEANGGEVQRYCYQGDVGRHIALSIWGLRLVDTDMPDESEPVSVRVAYFGKAYALGATRYKKLSEESKDENDRPNSKDFLEMDEEVRLINKKLYDRSDAEINELYDKGKEWSLQHFEELYDILGTKFDRYFFESAMGPIGAELVRENTAPKGKAIFEESDGAVIFPGEKYDLHTRVFLNKDGLPTYEAKEVGLAHEKYKVFPFDLAIITSANEINEYFKVLLKVVSLLSSDIASRMKHVSHGMLKLPTGKMSSRTGDVVAAHSFVQSITDEALEKMQERDMSPEYKKKVAEQVAIAALKYTILRQSIGKDVIYDPVKSLSFEGDSGPYLQYSCVRARAILTKAEIEGLTTSLALENNEVTALDHNGVRLEKLLERFPETVERSWKDLAPHTLANYLMELAGAFNSFYASTQIIKSDDSSSVYKVTVVDAFATVMKNGLNILGIQVPEKM